jgi:hypothetical protein
MTTTPTSNAVTRRRRVQLPARRWCRRRHICVTLRHCTCVRFQNFCYLFCVLTFTSTHPCGDSREAGRGDCLFHSIGAAFERMRQGAQLAAGHICARCDVGMFHQSPQHVVKRLRNISAASLLQWEDADLLNLFACYSLHGQCGRWEDRWSPSRLLHDHNFGELVGCDAVRAIGRNPSPDADSGDLIVAVTRSCAHAGGAASAEM